MRPLAGAQQIRQRGLAGNHRGSQIELVHCVPTVNCAFVEFFTTKSSGDIDQAVEPAGVLGDPVHRRTRRASLRQVDRRHTARAPSGGLPLRDGGMRSSASFAPYALKVAATAWPKAPSPPVTTKTFPDKSMAQLSSIP